MPLMPSTLSAENGWLTIGEETWLQNTRAIKRGSTAPRTTLSAGLVPQGPPPRPSGESEDDAPPPPAKVKGSSSLGVDMVPSSSIKAGTASIPPSRALEDRANFAFAQARHKERPPTKPLNWESAVPPSAPAASAPRKCMYSGDDLPAIEPTRAPPPRQPRPNPRPGAEGRDAEIMRFQKALAPPDFPLPTEDLLTRRVLQARHADEEKSDESVPRERCFFTGDDFKHPDKMPDSLRRLREVKGRLVMPEQLCDVGGFDGARRRPARISPDGVTAELLKSKAAAAADPTAKGVWAAECAWRGAVDDDAAKDAALRRKGVDLERDNRQQNEWGMREPARGRGELWTPWAPR
jgi:hypothetical protein